MHKNKYSKINRIILKKYTLGIKEHLTTPKIKLSEDAYIDLYGNPNLSQIAQKQTIQDGYRMQLIQILPELTAKYQAHTSLKAN